MHCASLRPWQTRTHCFGLIVAHDVSWAAQTRKHLLRTQSVSEQNQKHFLCPGHKPERLYTAYPDTKFVSATNVARTGKRGNISVGNNVSATMCPRLPGPLRQEKINVYHPILQLQLLRCELQEK